jgi:CSLREA domain-containing protein
VAAASLTLTTLGTTHTVNSVADSTDGICDASNCTLREAIAGAQNADLINFSALFNTPQNIDLTSALPAITRSIAIQGPGAQLLTVRRAFTAASDFRVFDIPGGVTNGVAISGMTISNGRTTNFGGGILSRSRLSLSGVHIAGNTATLGGGVFLGDTGGAFSASTLSGNVSTGDGGGLFFEGNNGDLLMVANSTVSGNHSAGNSGGIRTTRGQLQLTNTTVVGNTASSSPGGVLAIAQTAGNTSTVTLRSTIVSGNTPNNFAAVAVGGTASIQSQDFNLSDNYNSVFTPLASDLTSATPRLAPLALYGGTTPTHALLHGSPAIDAGDASGQPLDQRGVARVFGTNADIGAVEMRPKLVLNTNDSGPDSLRAVIDAANIDNDLDDIIFSGFFNTQRMIALTTGRLAISSPVNVIAPGANLLTVSGNNNSRVFEVFLAGTASLNGLTITAGSAPSGSGIFNNGALTVSHAAIAGNTASI